MSYKHYRFTAQEIAEKIRLLYGKRVSAQCVRDNRNGKRSNPEMRKMIAGCTKHLKNQ